MSAPRRGFSLKELLVVLTIITILAGLMLPAQRRIHGAAGRMQCANNLKNMSLAMHSYASVSGSWSPSPWRPDAVPDRFPSGCYGPGVTPEERLSWMVELLPFVEQDAAFHKFDAKAGYVGNSVPAQTRIKTYLCPESTETATGALTNYVAMSGIGADAATRPAGAPGNGAMGYDRITSLRTSFADGTSNTVLLMETRFDLGPWARGGTVTVRGFVPEDAPWAGEGRPFEGHKGVVQAGMADGSTRGISLTADPKVLAATITIAGGEQVSLD